MQITLELLYLTYIFVSNVNGDYNNSVRIYNEDFKCLVPELTIDDQDMDMEQFLENFAKVKEIKFPISYGPVTEKYICKLKCVDGYWVGPLCSSSTDGRFKTLLKECVYKHEYPLLTVYFRNSSIQNDTNFPHNTTISARCKYFGMYKLKGDSEIRCENGAWLSKFPECVPTTVITNFTGDAPPTIRYEVLDGSAIVEPNGELLVFPDSHIRIDCMALRSKGDLEWTWTQSMANYKTGWLDDYSNTFRINLPKLGVRFAETFTCSTPDGTTNKIVVRVVNVNCEIISMPAPYVRQYTTGNRLGESTHFSCEPGYHMSGASILYCMGDGHWSSPPPICEETFCPFFTSLNPQLSIIEHNSSFGGRAVFTCAWGYRLVGAPGLECEQDGQWSGEMPQCIPIYCPDPILPEHGQLVTKTISKDGKFPVGDLLIYACNEGYEVMGELSIVCTENGFWSHPPPFCLPPTEIKRLNTIYLENTTLVNLDSVY
ncbi:locomotion-related protein Hikaru genki isoform X2 [Leptidea sinapis]|uniref:locomotion-related protein Hikaru genki isoform X2 n=1 Tax=Leptidea sinapis TaxID=189913 RepID=UPI0021C2B35F|nr:locomotion-related protein Hikaru genki isoform X2 [Leptidea sinapis]